jgi:hypothetical protein
VAKCNAGDPLLIKGYCRSKINWQTKTLCGTMVSRMQSSHNRYGAALCWMRKATPIAPSLCDSYIRGSRDHCQENKKQNALDMSPEASQRAPTHCAKKISIRVGTAETAGET